MKNATAFVLAGKVVGGSSTINGMFFDRPSRHDMDAWATVASNGLGSIHTRWDWNAMFPFFKKVRAWVGIESNHRPSGRTC